MRLLPPSTTFAPARPVLLPFLFLLLTLGACEGTSELPKEKSGSEGATLETLRTEDYCPELVAKGEKLDLEIEGCDSADDLSAWRTRLGNVVCAARQKIDHALTIITAVEQRDFSKLTGGDITYAAESLIANYSHYLRPLYSAQGEKSIDLAHIRGSLEELSRGLKEGGKVHFRCLAKGEGLCQSDSHANAPPWRTQGDVAGVNLCPQFWGSSESTMQHTFVHELSHAYLGVLRSSLSFWDAGYGSFRGYRSVRTKEKRILSEEELYRNPDTLANFVMTPEMLTPCSTLAPLRIRHPIGFEGESVEVVEHSTTRPAPLSPHALRCVNDTPSAGESVGYYLAQQPPTPNAGSILRPRDIATR